MDKRKKTSLQWLTRGQRGAGDRFFMDTMLTFRTT